MLYAFVVLIVHLSVIIKIKKLPEDFSLANEFTKESSAL